MGMARINALVLPQRQRHVAKSIVPDARHHRGVCTLAGAGDGGIAAFATGQTLQSLTDQGLPARRWLRHPGHQVNVPAGHANHICHGLTR